MQRAVAEALAVQNLSHAALAAEVASTTCGAKTRSGAPCRNLPMRNGRCRMHGGASTGPKTAASRERIRAASTIHGSYGRDGLKLRDMIREAKAACRRLVEAV